MEEWKRRVSEFACLPTCIFVESTMIRLGKREECRADSFDTIYQIHSSQSHDGKRVECFSLISSIFLY